MKRRLRSRRRGNILAMTTVLMVVLIAFVALAVDIGYLYTCRNELQRSADAAAIAACWELVDRDGQAGSYNPTNLTTNARNKAVQYAAFNKVGSEAPALASDDVTVGYMVDPSDPDEALIPTPGGTLPNAVSVRVQRTTAQNGEIPLFFARAIGVDHAATQAQATAALVSGFNGFRPPADGSNLDILPFAIDQNTWDNLATFGTDVWRYDPDSKTVGSGPDGIKEINLFPQSTGVTGNRGTLDIGSGDSSTDDAARQIVDGVNESDLAYHGGTLEFDGSGELHLSGNTGISAGTGDELTSIIGKPRIMPIFSAVAGPGNCADYTIVRFVGVRVMYVKLTGSMAGRAVLIQPCNVVSKGGVRQEGATGTQYIYSPVWLVR